MNKRYSEVDILRGIAVVMMVIFHFVFDLDYFNIYKFNIYNGFWLYFARLIAIIFIFLVGVSLALVYYRKNFGFLDYFKKGSIVFGFGLLITLITWLFIREGTIIFGILHFIGISIILGSLFLRFKELNLVFGGILIGLGFYIKNFVVNYPWLVWLGLRFNNFYTLHYFPLLPWFGVILLGIYSGKLLYPKGKRRFNINLENKYLSFLGRHSLVIYLLHQPILILVINLFL